jgi:hypothetical protein
MADLVFRTPIAEKLTEFEAFLFEGDGVERFRNTHLSHAQRWARRRERIQQVMMRLFEQKRTHAAGNFTLLRGIWAKREREVKTLMQKSSAWTFCIERLSVRPPVRGHGPWPCTDLRLPGRRPTDKKGRNSSDREENRVRGWKMLE